MKDPIVSPRYVSKASRNRAVRPVVEGLEGRFLLYAYTGDHFAIGSRITWSIMPDGTSLGGTTSNLVSTLDSRIGAGTWEQLIRDAFAQWEQYGNVNLVQVADDGEPINSGNYQQGNPNFGDIRIGGFAQASNVLAFTLLPPPSFGGSDSGDIFFNTSQVWNFGSTFDLGTVAVHEIGHAVAGLGESSDPNAAEYEYYTGIKGLDQDDVNGIQAVWGPRAEDAIAKATGNFTAAKAADITGYINPYNNVIVLPNQDVASPTESYWFKVTTPSNTNTSIWVQIQSAGLSELSPKVQIYNSNLQGLSQTAAPWYAYGTTIWATAPNVAPGQTYYIKVSGSSSLWTGAGAYGMSVDLGPWALSPVVPANIPVYTQPDQGGQGLFEKTATANAHGSHTSKVDTTDLSPLGIFPTQGAFLEAISTKTSPAKHKPTHIKVAHPVDTHLRKHPTSQDTKPKYGQK